ncbi:3,4-dihydroxy-2-butanone 4-phosphate synthase [Aliarcobacter thereius]|uniref:3,4-dihydroxy-2-butanone 4-phosphate synthase n=3 Tax=Aliarcobacter thereius TaxID=544718 RepID=A0A1C0B731_9BACT|nr:3,4-dihydroxy-2-butanone-4-phosphate synthase [Aliarcobacter thereius]OCL86903.1 3,4-dihydroxy-2-butanone 4-phosphate synthase [Aliarcobacter thereius]OCL96063.1 3,4-dihydroxy-2-butanone 4-phosphate synthase [Aliarcobacter thereius LMG 24486]OCL99394.1 3,4-dihydroxy-2-butanone 4-phosphate synthase [Aliarcobacter thereius]QBF15965.1 3,4-dihydroxy-2-butanone 4-phosphate synthase [Aliarcobacter thereius LMG 24486]HJE02683.1 3,4-dihydroxy-2-butanone-4-phosphate synthase [Aliarcobacter thereius]
MNQQMSNSQKNINKAIKALQNGTGIIITDDKNRENEADIIFHANTITDSQMALLIRECSGIVCLCLTPQKVKELNLPMMVKSNNSRFQTPFTISIESKEGITTGVSAKDRVKTIKSALKKDGINHIISPGHIFPLCAKQGGVLERNGHTEASIDMMKLANLEPNAVLCEITNEDGTMAKGEQITNFAKKHSMPIISIEEIIEYRLNKGE